MIQIPSNPYRRPVDNVSPRRSDAAPVQQATGTVQRVKAARDRRNRYERRTNQTKQVLMDRRLGADRRGPSINISI